jgi:hypothetical protein
VLAGRGQHLSLPTEGASHGFLETNLTSKTSSPKAAIDADFPFLLNMVTTCTLFGDQLSLRQKGAAMREECGSLPQLVEGEFLLL